MHSRTVCKAGLAARFYLVNVEVLRYLIQLTPHLEHDIVAFIVRVLLNGCWQAICSLLNLLTVVGWLELHYGRQVFLLLRIQHVCQLLLR